MYYTYLDQLQIRKITERGNKLCFLTSIPLHILQLFPLIPGVDIQGSSKNKSSYISLHFLIKILTAFPD